MLESYSLIDTEFLVLWNQSLCLSAPRCQPGWNSSKTQGMWKLEILKSYKWETENVERAQTYNCSEGPRLEHRAGPVQLCPLLTLHLGRKGQWSGQWDVTECAVIWFLRGHLRHLFVVFLLLGGWTQYLLTAFYFIIKTPVSIPFSFQNCWWGNSLVALILFKGQGRTPGCFTSCHLPGLSLNSPHLTSLPMTLQKCPV